MHPLKLYYLGLRDEWWQAQFDSSRIPMSEEEKLQTIKEGKEFAYNCLKMLTEQDFGYDADTWEEWLQDNTDTFSENW